MTLEEATEERIKAEQEIAIILNNLQEKTGLFIDSAEFLRTAAGNLYLQIKIYV